MGGKNRLPMADLAGLVTELGCKHVRTYIQSGNVLLEAPAAAAKRLPAALTALIEERTGLRVPVVVRSSSELASVLANNPFLARGVAPSALHVAFLADTPSTARGAALDASRSPGDEFQLVGRDVYLYLPSGMGRTKLTSDYIDRTLGTTSTARNWRTVETLVAMLSS